MVPTRISFLLSFPSLPSGKVDRKTLSFRSTKGLSEMNSSLLSSSSSSSSAPPSSSSYPLLKVSRRSQSSSCPSSASSPLPASSFFSVEKQQQQLIANVRRVVEGVMGVDGGVLGEDESLFLFGCSSMMVLRVMGELERVFGKVRGGERERGELLEQPTLRRLCQYFLWGEGEKEEGGEKREGNQRGKRKEMEWFPLTDSQERIYMWECLNGTAAYTMQYRWRVGKGGRIERRTMEQALRGLLDSLPLLRVEFSAPSLSSPLGQGKGSQRVRRRGEVEVPLIWVEGSVDGGWGQENKGMVEDNGTWEDRAKGMCQTFATDVSADVFSIFSSPLFRVYVLNVSSEPHHLTHQELIINIHHLLLDDLSARTVFQCLSKFYVTSQKSSGKFEKDEDWAFEEVARERGEYDGKEKEREKGARDGLVEYLGKAVKENEEAGVSVCTFPKDGGEEETNPRGSLPFNPTPGATQILSIDPQLALSLSLLCDSLSVSLYSLSFACFSMLMERYMGGGVGIGEEGDSPHVILGCPFANRGWTSGWDSGRAATTTSHTAIDGCLVNVLPVSVTLSKRNTIADAIRSTDISIRTTQRFERASFDGVLRDLGVSRRHDSTPLFGVVFAHHDAAGGMGLGGGLGGVEVEYIPWTSRSAKFDMTVTLFERGGGGEGEEEGSCFLFEYRRDCYSRGFVESVVENFEYLLRWVSGCVGEGEGRDLEKVGWRDLEVLSERSVDRLSRWSLPRFFFLYFRFLLLLFSFFSYPLSQNRNLPSPNPPSLASLLHTTALTYPSSIALHHLPTSQEITYSQLLSLSTTLARSLLHRTSSFPSPPSNPTYVGLYISHSLEAIVGIFACLFLGWGYVPLDPLYPLSRLSYIWKNCGASVLLFSPSLQPPPGLFLEGEEEEGKRVCLRVDFKELQDPTFAASFPSSLSLPSPSSLSFSPAYLIYTSGSTGKPKGVKIAQHNVARLFCDALRDTPLQFSEKDRWVLFSSLSFDASVWEIFGALIFGGRLILISEEGRMVPEVLYGILRDEGVTSFFQTPSSFMRLVEYEQQMLQKQQQQQQSLLFPLSPLPSLRTIVFGGEELYPPNLSQWVENHPFFDLENVKDGGKGKERERDGRGKGINYVNMYGITETTVHVTFHTVTMEEIKGEGKEEGGEKKKERKRERGGEVGRPLRDMGVVVVDKWGRLCPEGVVGEMVVVGGGVGGGYVELGEVTKKRFGGVMVGDEGRRLKRRGVKFGGDYCFGGKGGGEGVVLRGYVTGDRGRWELKRKGGKEEGSLLFLGRRDLQVFFIFYSFFNFILFFDFFINFILLFS